MFAGILVFALLSTLQLRARIRMLTYCHPSFRFNLAIAIEMDLALRVALTRSITTVLVTKWSNLNFVDSFLSFTYLSLYIVNKLYHPLSNRPGFKCWFSSAGPPALLTLQQCW